ncbi:MAG: hypothetical protein ILN61_11060 [Lachnospiraceae bacterium]|nr:hypothetical protein [Lachnospiraceae bacterium]
MKDANEKKNKTIKVYKVLLGIYSCILIGMDLYTVIGWITRSYDTDYMILACLNAAYCALLAEYEVLKKKEAKTTK